MSALCPAPALAAGVLTKAPALLESVEATYPAEAKAEGITGEVVLEIDIGATGEVLAAEVIEGAGHGFDEAAVEAVLQFRFSPAEIDDVPTAVRIEYRYRFFFRPEPEVVEAPPPPAVNLRGEVLERGKRRPVRGATVDVGDGAFLTYTDEEGRFEVAGVPPGEVRVVVVDGSFERFETEEVIEADTLTEVKYYLYRAIDSPYETVVVGKREKKEVSTVAISAGELSKLPGVSGDTVKVVQNLPGVARAPYGSGRMVVRGGNPNDTRTYIDGQHVPILFHFGGITSVYSSELVQEVQFEPGNFGARYGRAIGGRVELITREARRERLNLVADVDLFDATGLAEGPVTDDVSVAFAARRSYVDAVILAATQAAPDAFDGIGFSIAPRYYDYQTKVSYQVDPRNRVQLDLYGSSDKLSLVGVDTGGVEGLTSMSTTTSFTRVGLTWDRQVGPSTRTKVQLFPGWEQIGVTVDPIFFRMDNFTLSSRLEAIHELSPSFSMGAGLDLVFTSVQLSARLNEQQPAGQIPAPDFRDRLIPMEYDIAAAQPAVWTEAVWEPVSGLKLVPGLRLDYDSFIQSYWFDPRFAVRWSLSADTTLKGGAGLYHQPPVEQYVIEELGNPALKEEGAAQYSVGIEQRIAGPISLDTQLYYKDLFDQAISSDRVIVRNGEKVPERYANEGSGRAYGAELLLRYNPDGRFFGWIAYSISRTERDRNLLSGSWSGASNDQPHNLVALGSLELPEIWRGLTFGFRMRYTTGNPMRESSGGIYDVDADDYRRLPVVSSLDRRLPDFFQLDLRLDKSWAYEESSFTAYIDVQNVTNRTNAEGISYNFDSTRWAYSPGLPIFPSIGFRYEY